MLATASRTTAARREGPLQPRDPAQPRVRRRGDRQRPGLRAARRRDRPSPRATLRVLGDGATVAAAGAGAGCDPATASAASAPPRIAAAVMGGRRRRRNTPGLGSCASGTRWNEFAGRARGRPGGRAAGAGTCSPSSMTHRPRRNPDGKVPAGGPGPARRPVRRRGRPAPPGGGDLGFILQPPRRGRERHGDRRRGGRAPRRVRSGRWRAGLRGEQRLPGQRHRRRAGGGDRGQWKVFRRPGEAGARPSSSPGSTRAGRPTRPRSSRWTPTTRDPANLSELAGGQPRGGHHAAGPATSWRRDPTGGLSARSAGRLRLADLAPRYPSTWRGSRYPSPPGGARRHRVRARSPR